MKKCMLWVMMLILDLAIPGISFLPGNAQVPWVQTSNSQTSLSQKIRLMTYTIPQSDQDTVNLKCFLQIPHSILQFIKTDTLFKAQFELTLALKDVEKETVGESIIPKTISTTQYGVTTADDVFVNESISFFIPPGQYRLIIDLHDRELEKPIRREEKLTVTDYFKEPIMTNGLIFFTEKESGTQSDQFDFPVFPPSRTVTDSTLYGLFYVCTRLSSPKVMIVKSIIDDASKVFSRDTSFFIVTSKIHPVSVSLNQDLTFGRYSLKIDLVSEGTKLSMQSSFFIRLGSHTSYLPHLDQAVEVLYYIMDRDECKRMKALPPEEKQRQFEEFWQSKDPDPSTPINELEEEYYRRVTESNESFSIDPKQKDGWRTDRGRIYITYGQPSYVERPSVASGGPSQYEIWYFNNIKRKFYFLDKYGSGNYLLVSEE